MLYGVDCASHQGYPDWPQLKAEGHSFMVTKVTGEGEYVNPYWRDNHDRARAAGLIPGTYDWVEPQNAASQSGEEAARDYLRVVGARLFNSLLCVDFETPEWATGVLGRNIEPWMREYMYTLRDLSHKMVIPYSAPYFMRETGAEHWDWLAKDFLYWMAAPGPAEQLPDTAPWPPTVTGPWQMVTLHQHQWHASSSAVRGNFDRNRFRGTYGDLLLYANGEFGGDVREPEAGKFTAYVNDQGEPIFVWNVGGQTPPDGIVGINVQDLGMTVKSATEPGMVLDRSVQGNVVHEFNPPRQG